MAITELDYMEYATDAAAQAAWVHNATDSVDTPGTKLLIHFDGADGATTHTAASGQTVTFAGTAQLDTAQKKFGSASLLLDGNSDYVTVPDSANWDILFSSGFTFDCWVRFNDATGPQSFFGQFEDTNNHWYFKKDSSTHKLHFIAIVGGVTKADYIMSSNWDLSENTWYHIRLVRRLATVSICINGVSQTLTESTAISINDIQLASNLFIGALNSSNFFNGWIDEVRILNNDTDTTFTPLTYAYTPIQSFTNTTQEVQGTYCLKLTNFYGSGSLSVTGKTFTKTLSNIDLSFCNRLYIYVYRASGTIPFNLKIHDSGGTTTTFTLTNGVNVLDLSSVAVADKDAIDSIILTYTGTPSGADDVYFDNIYAYSTENTQIVIL